MMAGPVTWADETVTTTALGRVLEYEPRDLTISVEAGLPWRELTALLRQNRQMVPLDPPFAARATVGGVVASNSSGPRRRLYGTARDMVIGMGFVTLERKLVQSGGMVVKNVAGLDMAKLMIGSFGTLAAIAVVNFKVQPMPEVERTVLLSFADSKAVFASSRPPAFERVAARRHRPVQPARRRSGQRGLDSGRARRRQPERGGPLPARAGRASATARSLEGAPHEEFWQQVEDFTPRFLAAHPMAPWCASPLP
jgi:glycolate oxidase FAD binding subunit